MCGIAGVYEREDRLDLGRLRAMSELLKHRGPDGEGIVLIDPDGPGALTLGGPDTTPEVLASTHAYAPGRWQGMRGAPPKPAVPADANLRVGLMQRRLAILDLSPAGHQPMCDADGVCWITFNGEIYNFVEIRAELEATGVRFMSGSDTEVILAAYRKYGRRCLERFNGMFALAIWDGEKRELFCARDRLGVKPFYYQWDGRHFAFASEPKALVLTQARPIRPRLPAIRDLLALDWVDHDSRTFFEDLWALPPAHYLVVGANGFEIQRWWGLDPERRATGDPIEWEREFERLFTDAVRLRLRADVEVGSALSGGLDSSAVVTTAARLASRPLHAFTCAYDEGPAFDERPYVRLVCEATGTLSKVVVPDGGDFWPLFDRLTRAQDEPTAGSGLYSQWKVMDLAHRSGLKVLLDGQGADETLAGYFRYLPIRLRDQLAAGHWGSMLKTWGTTADRIGPTTTMALVLEPWLPRPLVAALRRRFGQGKERVLSSNLSALRETEARPRPPAEFPTALSRQLAFDTVQRLLPSLLRYEDRNSMAFSIETRLPFLDYRLVEFAFSLPDDQRIDGDVTKSILRRSLADRIPARIAQRRDKMGFETPTDLWLRRHFPRELKRRLLAPGLLHEWMNPSVLSVEIDEFLAGRRPIGLQIWRWLSLESWARTFIEADPRVATNASREGLGGVRRTPPARAPRRTALEPVALGAGR